jgi:hypothetical protein
MPWERQSELSKEDRNDLKADRQPVRNTEVLKKLILTNPTIFPAYQDNKEKGITDKIIRKIRFIPLNHVL